MGFLTALWFPILLSAVLVFFAAFIMWTVLPHHRTDWSPLPDQDGIMADLRERGVEPGMYSFPFHADRESEEYREKVRKGPVGLMLIGRPEKRLSMGTALAQTFVYYLVLGVFIAYLAWHALEPGAEYEWIFRVVGTAALLAHAGTLPVRAIHYGFDWSQVGKESLDGLVYALLTAGSFAGFWPGG